MEHVALGKNILVEDVTDEKLSEGGIILPDGQSVADSKRSRVVSVSESLERMFVENSHAYPINIGDIVYHAYHIGTPITTHDGRKLRAIHYDNVLSIEV